jgi:competence protein ComGC
MTGLKREGKCSRVFLVIVVLLVVGVPLYVFLRVVQHAPSRELARRAACQSNLISLDSALREYEQLHGEYPVSLRELVAAGLVDPASLRCPSAEAAGAGDYVYDREAAAEQNGIVITERADNHQRWEQSVGLLRPLCSDLDPAQYALLADGRVVNLKEK